MDCGLRNDTPGFACSARRSDPPACPSPARVTTDAQADTFSPRRAYTSVTRYARFSTCPLQLRPCRMKRSRLGLVQPWGKLQHRAGCAAPVRPKIEELCALPHGNAARHSTIANLVRDWSALDSGFPRTPGALQIRLLTHCQPRQETSVCARCAVHILCAISVRGERELGERSLDRSTAKDRGTA